MIERIGNIRLAALRGEDLLLLGAVVLLPWAFGGVEMWAFRTAAFALALAFAWHLWRGDADGGDAPSGHRWWVWPSAALAIWGLAQVCPLPAPVVERLSPQGAAFQAPAFPPPEGAAEPSSLQPLELGAVARVPEAALPEPFRGTDFGGAVSLPRGRGRTLSLHPAATLERVFWFAALAMAFFLVQRRTRDPEVRGLYQGALFALGGLLALSALAQLGFGNGKLLWVRSVETDRFLGPYVNPSHFAGVMEMLAPWIAGYVLARGQMRGRDALKEGRFPVTAGILAACLAAALLSGSKMGVLGIGGALVLLAWLRVGRWWQRGLVVVVAAAAVLVLVAGVGDLEVSERIRSYFERSGDLVPAEGRLVAWRACVPMAKDFLLTGSGLGAFGDVFPHYMPPGENALWEQAHNDYLEFFLGAGLLGAVPLALLIVGFWRRALRGLPGRDDPSRWAELGLLIGLGLLFVHAAADFNHQIPANALLFVVMAGLALTRGAGRRDRGTRREGA